jgi:hypothetical protein
MTIVDTNSDAIWRRMIAPSLWCNGCCVSWGEARVKRGYRPEKTTPLNTRERGEGVVFKELWLSEDKFCASNNQLFEYII